MRESTESIIGEQTIRARERYSKFNVAGSSPGIKATIRDSVKPKRRRLAVMEVKQIVMGLILCSEIIEMGILFAVGMDLLRMISKIAKKLQLTLKTLIVVFFIEVYLISNPKPMYHLVTTEHLVLPN